MATNKQNAANRENRGNTATRTEQGKAISRMNALKHGIDAEYEVAWDEYAEELKALTAEYDREWQPIGIAERVLVDLLVRKQWLMNRQPNISAGLTNYGTAKAVCDPRELHAVGAGYTVNTESTTASTGKWWIPNAPTSATSRNSRNARPPAASTKTNTPR